MRAKLKLERNVLLGLLPNINNNARHNVVLGVVYSINEQLSALTLNYDPNVKCLSCKEHLIDCKCTCCVCKIPSYKDFLYKIPNVSISICRNCVKCRSCGIFRNECKDLEKLPIWYPDTWFYCSERCLYKI